MTREELLRREYLGRIERVIDHVYAHFGEELGVDELADVAAFSRFHFHRVFASVVGETVSDFVKRVRLERAAARLVDHPEESVTEVAMATGFSSPSVFARSFKERFGVPASAWRDLDREGRRALAASLGDEGAGGRPAAGGSSGGPAGGTEGQALRTDSQAESREGQERRASGGYPSPIALEKGWRKGMDKLEFKVEVKELPELTVAYARHVGAFRGIGEAFARLGRWAGPRGLYAAPGALSLAVYHDSPETTEESKLRSSACVSVPKGTEVSGDINLMTLPGGKYAVARFEIRPDEFGRAWDAFMGEWFPSSGWQPDDRPCYEVYVSDPDKHPEGKFVVDICEPVRPL